LLLSLKSLLFPVAIVMVVSINFYSEWTRVTNPHVIFDVKKGQAYKTPEELNRILQTTLDELRRRSPDGEILDWENVTQRFRTGDEAQVRDLDSGKISVCAGQGDTIMPELNRLASRIRLQSRLFMVAGGVGSAERWLLS